VLAHEKIAPKSPPRPEQSLDLGILKLDDLLLTLIHPRRKRYERQVPGLQDLRP